MCFEGGGFGDALKERWDLILSKQAFPKIAFPTFKVTETWTVGST